MSPEFVHSRLYAALEEGNASADLRQEKEPSKGKEKTVANYRKAILSADICGNDASEGSRGRFSLSQFVFFLLNAVGAHLTILQKNALKKNN